MAKSKYTISNTDNGITVSVDGKEVDKSSGVYSLGLEYAVAKQIPQGKSATIGKNELEKMYPKPKEKKSSTSFKPKGVPAANGKAAPVKNNQKSTGKKAEPTKPANNSSQPANDKPAGNQSEPANKPESASSNANTANTPVTTGSVATVNVVGKRKKKWRDPGETAREKALAHQKVNTASYDGLYTKYYSCSDFNLYIGDILIDRAAGVAIGESLTSTPIYTIGNSRYDFLARGNVIVNGIIRINKAERDYLARVITHYRGRTNDFRLLSSYEQLQLTTSELAKYRKQLRQYYNEQVSAKSVLDWADLGSFTINMVYNNADAVTEGVQQRISIIECRIVGYEHSVDIGSDGQLIDGYKFIAKEVIPE